MFTFADVLVDGLWVIGLAGLVATFSYVGWYRQQQGWNWPVAFRMPRLLMPFCLSLAFFCIGMALNGRASVPPAPLWESAAWSILIVLFAFFSLAYWMAGVRRGWDTPIQGGNRT